MRQRAFSGSRRRDQDHLLPAIPTTEQPAPFVKIFTAIDRYIFRLVLMPMLAVFVIAASLLVLDKMLKLFDFVATEGGPA